MLSGGLSWGSTREETTCWWPVMRAFECFPVAGSHRNMVKSSDPDTNRSGESRFAAVYLTSAAYTQCNIVILLCCCTSWPNSYQ